MAFYFYFYFLYQRVSSLNFFFFKFFWFVTINGYYSNTILLGKVISKVEACARGVEVGVEGQRNESNFERNGGSVVTEFKLRDSLKRRTESLPYVYRIHGTTTNKIVILFIYLLLHSSIC